MIPKGFHQSIETRRKISNGHLITHKSKSYGFLKGGIPWNKGKTGIKTMDKGRIPWNKGKNNKVAVKCHQCGKIDFIVPSRIPRYRYCSKNCQFQSLKWRQKICEKRLRQILPKRDTVPERKMEKALKRLGIPYLKQQHIKEAKCIADFVILHKKLVIFVDGQYWHSKPEVAKRDVIQEKLLKENGWRYKRFLDKSLRSMSSVYKSLEELVG